MSDYANYIFAKHKTDSAKSYSHYTRFYALIRRVCTPAKTWGFSSNKRDNPSRFTPRQATVSELHCGKVSKNSKQGYCFCPQGVIL